MYRSMRTIKADKQWTANIRLKLQKNKYVTLK